MKRAAILKRLHVRSGINLCVMVNIVCTEIEIKRTPCLGLILCSLHHLNWRFDLKYLLKLTECWRASALQSFTPCRFTNIPKKSKTMYYSCSLSFNPLLSSSIKIYTVVVCVDGYCTEDTLWKLWKYLNDGTYKIPAHSPKTLLQMSK